MVSYFPVIYPDELLYSVLARYHRHTASRSPKRTLDDLFGERTVRATVDLPGHLGALSRRLPAERCLAPERLAAELTLFPYYAAFQPASVVREVLTAMIDGATDSVHVRLGLAASIVPAPDTLRFCPQCFAEAVTRWGEPYWRRSHQLPGALVCAEHGAPLRDSSVHPVLGRQHEFQAATAETCADGAGTASWEEDERCLSLLHAVAVRSAALLERFPTGVSSADLTPGYRDALIDRRLASAHGRVDQQKLRDTFDTVLGPLRRVLVAVAHPVWLPAIVRKHRHAFHPLHHILLDLVIDRYAPASVAAVDGTASTGRKRITDSGFDGRLCDLAAAGFSLRATARALAVDPNTVRKHSADLGLATTWRPLSRSPQLPKPPSSPIRRARWIDLRRREPELGRKALADRLPADHTWLYRHDRDWLEAHSPPPTIHWIPGPRADWPLIDRSLAANLRVAAGTILGRIPPVRVTLAELERHVGRRGWISKRYAKLPETVATLTEVTESVEAFRLRRVGWARHELEATGATASPWKVRRLAGLPKRASAAVEEALREGRTPKR
ncbi:TnsD family Tn7-like transposition protein [Azospirillum sp. TSO22-1]|uniref:TnsD family Tn7-like transposition protein n=1 Tax=Azospirillum sp. TSO22-1 TaxID=716789 RepID=UPI000D60C2D3|nr:TnsD family Tn7-like transposition protein [Azospirillum sp. TSO22-1]PWC35274.1 hypothetical protein TSO221_30100 [Azospirillum sp. TSO22-1]